MNNPPAFPVVGSPGITLRDYLASKAMQSLILHPQAPNPFDEPQHTAKQAYRLADAMMAEGEKGKTS